MPRRTTLAVSAALAAASLLPSPAGAAAPPAGALTPADRAFLRAELASVEKERLEVRSQLRRKRVELALLGEKEKGYAKGAVPADKAEALITTSAELQTLLARGDQINRQLMRARELAVRGDADPSVQRLRAQLQGWQKEFNARRAKLLAGARDEARREVL